MVINSFPGQSRGPNPDARGSAVSRCAAENPKECDVAVSDPGLAGGPKAVALRNRSPLFCLLHGAHKRSRFRFWSFADFALAFSQAPSFDRPLPGIGDGPEKQGRNPMEVYTQMKHVRIAAVVLAVCLLVVCQTVALAQNLGAAPQTNVAVQGQTGAQPEGAFLNFVNWVGNVIAPVGAGVAVVGGIVSYASGRGYIRWIGTALGLLAVSGLTRLLEFWIQQGTGGVS